MGRTITNHEMDRRIACADAKYKLTEAMETCPELTPLEWLYVLSELAMRVQSHGLKEEWAESDATKD